MTGEHEVTNADSPERACTRLDQGSAAATREQLVLRLRSFQERLNRLAERVRSQRAAPLAERATEHAAAEPGGQLAEAHDPTTLVHEGRAVRQPRLPSVRALRRHSV